MASGFLTNDGKDLDSRYLGINAKAASAATADNVTNKGTIKRSGGIVKFQLVHNGYYTATATGVVSAYNSYLAAFSIGSADANAVASAVFVNKGDRVYLVAKSDTGSTKYNCALTPVSIS